MGKWSKGIVRRAAATVACFISVGACSAALAAEAIRIVATDSGFEAPRRTATDVKRWYRNDLKGAAPADALGGVLDSHNIKRVVWLKKTFSPGRDVLHCALPVNHDAKSGEHSPVHADLGMVANFEIEE